MHVFVINDEYGRVRGQVECVKELTLDNGWTTEAIMLEDAGQWNWYESLPMYQVGSDMDGVYMI